MAWLTFNFESAVVTVVVDSEQVWRERVLEAFRGMFPAEGVARIARQGPAWSNNTAPTFGLHDVHNGRTLADWAAEQSFELPLPQ